MATGSPIVGRPGPGKGWQAVERAVIAAATLGWSAVVLAATAREITLPHQDFVVLARPLALVAVLVFTEAGTRWPVLR